MASKDSGGISTGSNYALGDYSFRIERSSGTSPNYDKIEAICTKGGKNARKSIQVPSSAQLAGWYVEATETEASVYVQIKEDLGLPVAPSGASSGHISASGGGSSFGFEGGSGRMTFIPYNGATYYVGVYASATSGTTVYRIDSHGVRYPAPLANTYTFAGKTVYYRASDGGPWTAGTASPSSSAALYGQSYAKVAWALIYGMGNGATKDMLVGRFAIDTQDAGGVGPGSDWTDPEDYDEDWEEGDPTHTLYVEVTGALSGRHNDPIVDPSYSYIPYDKETVKDYGCGGDGGHGGGGGAGASTVVVHKFATNQANSKEVTALARRHGYGSGGGKGGKGGDGCILVYY